MWDITHGDAQYQWLRKTLSESKAKYKFVFAHHARFDQPIDIRLDDRQVGPGFCEGHRLQGA